MLSKLMYSTIAILTLLLSGCATPVIQNDIPNLERSSNVPVVDLRPETEKKTENFSLLITSSAYGISRRGDDSINPPVTQMLRHRAFEKLGERGSVELKIHHFVSYLNLKSSLRKTAIGAGVGGVVGALIGSSASSNSVNLSQSEVEWAQFDSLAQKEHERAFYTAEENPSNAPVFVIYLDAEINGQRRFVKTISPTTAQNGKNPYVLAVESTIDYLLSKY